MICGLCRHIIHADQVAKPNALSGATFGRRKSTRPLRAFACKIKARSPPLWFSQDYDKPAPALAHPNSPRSYHPGVNQSPWKKKPVQVRRPSAFYAVYISVP